MQQERSITMNFLASSSVPLPFLSQIWHSNDSFILMWHNQVLLGGLWRKTPFGSLPKQELYCLDCSFCRHRLIFPSSPALYIFHVAGCYSPCSVSPCSCPTPNRQWLKWDVVDNSLGTGCTISSISQLNYMPLLAQWKSCVLQAVAHDYVNQCALVTSQARRCSGRPAAPGRHYPQKYYIHGWGGRKNEGQRHKLGYLCMLINCYATCMNFSGLYEKPEPDEVYSI